MNVPLERQRINEHATDFNTVNHEIVHDIFSEQSHSQQLINTIILDSFD